ncbi:MAG: hypothetical protein CM15mV142_540 [Caudoviricetes sp.]|nr:MAG: hypothetical protein CM15mV142_540 [Caudoviricetes sp.]
MYWNASCNNICRCFNWNFASGNQALTNVIVNNRIITATGAEYIIG